MKNCITNKDSVMIRSFKVLIILLLIFFAGCSKNGDMPPNVGDIVKVHLKFEGPSTIHVGESAAYTITYTSNYPIVEGSGIAAPNMTLFIESSESNVLSSLGSCSLKLESAGSHCVAYVKALGVGKASIYLDSDLPFPKYELDVVPSQLIFVEVLPPIQKQDLTLSTQQTNVIVGESAMLTVSTPTAVSSNVLVDFSSNAPSIVANPSSCTILSGSSNCTTSLVGLNVGNAMITASNASYNPGSINMTFTAAPPPKTTHYAYITNSTGSGLTALTKCTIESTNGMLNNCVNIGDDLLDYPHGVAINNQRVYIAGSNDMPFIVGCNIESTTGNPINCSEASERLVNPYGVAFYNSQAFVTENESAAYKVYTINNDGSFGNESQYNISYGTSFGIGVIAAANGVYLTTDNLQYNVNLCKIIGIPQCQGNTIGSGLNNRTTALNLHNNLMYISINELGSGKVMKCTLDDSNIFGSCVDSGATFMNTPQGIAFYESHSYIVESQGTVSICDVNSSTGMLSNCQNSGASMLTDPIGIVTY